MSAFPQYEDEGNELPSFQNSWRDIEEQSVTGTENFNPSASLNTVDNLIVLKLTAIEYTEMLSSLFNGAIQTYPDRFMQIIVNFLQGLHNPPLLEEQDCFEYPTYSSFVAYSPINPFLQPDEIPDGYEEKPFGINGENGLDLPNYEPKDIIVSPAAITLDVDWFADISGQLPTIEVMVIGAGKVYLKFLSIVGGGLVVVTVDDPPSLIDIIGGVVGSNENIIDLNQDIVSLPPETAIETLYELDIVGTGIHTIYCVFLPILDDSLIPLRFGGGFRGVTLCDFVEEPETMGIQNIRLDECGLQFLNNGEWEDVFGWENLETCIGGFMATQEEIKQAIVDAAEQLATQMLAGEAENMLSGFTVSKDTGEKVFSGIEEVDDPSTPLVDEGRASAMGGTIAVLKAIEKFLDRCDTYYGATNGTPTTPLASAQNGMNLLFEADTTELDFALDDYYNWRITNPRILYDGSVSHQLYMYCKGSNKLAWNNLLIELSGYAQSKIDIVARLTNSLLPAFWEKYYSEGTALPSTIYNDAGCVPSPTEIFYYNQYATGMYTQTSWKANHRLKIRAENYWSDVDGDILDMCYYVDAPNLPVSRIANWFLQIGGTNLAKPTVNQVPYSASHVYEFTVDTPNVIDKLFISLTGTTGMNAPITESVAGQGIKLTIVDLGEVAV